MCITELWWIGASARQSADIKPNSKVLPLSQPSHEAEHTLSWQNIHTAVAGGFLVTLGSLGDTQPHGLAAWVTPLYGPRDTQPCALPGERSRPLAAVLLLGWLSLLGVFSCEHEKVDGSGGLLWNLKHLITFVGILGWLQGRNLFKSSLYHREPVSFLMSPIRNIWDTWKGKSSAKARQVEACESKALQLAGEFRPVLRRGDGRVQQLHNRLGLLWCLEIF